MHYLEDELELLEDLPDEIRKNFHMMRELDEHYQVAKSKLNNEVLAFLGTVKNVDDATRKKRCDEINEEYQSIRDVAEEKIAITEYIQLALEKYQERVEKDLGEFKQELEADTVGITATIEKELVETMAAERTFRSAQPSTSQQVNDLDESSISSFEDIKPQPRPHLDRLKTPEPYSRINGYTALDRHQLNHRQAAQRMSISQENDAQVPKPTSSTTPDDDIYDAEIASPKRTTTPYRFSSASVSPSLIGEAVDGIFFPPQVPPSSSRIAGTSIRPPLLKIPSFSASSSTHGRPRKLTKRVEQLLTTGGVEGELRHLHPAIPSHHIATISAQTGTGVRKKRRKRRSSIDISEQSQGEEENYDDEEGRSEEGDDDKTWCICNQTSYGDMIACDNQECKFEWFHYQCVGVKKKPIGRWFCPICTSQMNQ